MRGEAALFGGFQCSLRLVKGNGVCLAWILAALFLGNVRSDDTTSTENVIYAESASENEQRTYNGSGERRNLLLQQILRRIPQFRIITRKSWLHIKMVKRRAEREQQRKGPGTTGHFLCPSASVSLYRDIHIDPNAMSFSVIVNSSIISSHAYHGISCCSFSHGLHSQTTTWTGRFGVALDSDR